MKEPLSRENWNKRVGLAPWGWLLLGFIMSFGSSPGAPMWFLVGLLAMVIHLVVAGSVEIDKDRAAEIYIPPLGEEEMVADSTLVTVDTIEVEEEWASSYPRHPDESQEAYIARLAREAIRGKTDQEVELERVGKEFAKALHKG